MHKGFIGFLTAPATAASVVNSHMATKRPGVLPSYLDFFTQTTCALWFGWLDLVSVALCIGATLKPNSLGGSQIGEPLFDGCPGETEAISSLESPNWLGPLSWVAG